MSAHYNLVCETDGVTGPSMRVGWQAGRVTLQPKVGTHEYHHATGAEHEAAAQRAWIDFLQDHEFCQLRLAWS